jgi:outer membrane protein assembly factor BamD
MPPSLLKNRNLIIAALSLSVLGGSSTGAFAQGTVPKATTGSSTPAPKPAAKTPAATTDTSTKAANSKKTEKKEPAQPTVEPDKVLYDRAMVDMKKSHYIEGRLALQTLINTYPDSEYLAKAKLGVADSYYKEGGTANTTEAIQEYKDFITFFPFLDEAAYAQMQVAMAHYKMMEKPDRDKSEGNSAEDEFQTFLLKYPQSPLVPQAEQKLREAQEILADSQFRVGRFYYLKFDYSASAARLVDLSQRYPLYSQSDQALWMLGDIYSRAKQGSKNEDDKNHWADLAAQCYDRILKDYPLSKVAPDAKARLVAMGMPIPEADPNAVAEMKKQQLYVKQHSQHFFVKLPMEMMKSHPDVTLAARTGQPNLNAPDDAISATDVLKQGASGPSFNLAMRPSKPDINADSNVSQGSPVEAVSTQGESSSGGDGLNLAVGIIEGAPPAGTAASTAADTGSTAPASPVVSSSSASDLSGATAISLEPTSGNGVTPTTTVATTQATTGSNNPPAADPKLNTSKADPKTESTSKKKKGLKKVIPF